jgi:predicted Zn-dependent protease
MRHYLGAVLLEADRAAEAEDVYRRDLRWNQNNGWSLFGLYQALDMQGKEQEAQEVYAEYEASWKNSDVMLARSRL